MNTKSNTIRLFLATLAVAAFAAVAQAGPGIQYWQTLGDTKAFEQVKTGDKVLYVCNECKSLSEVSLDSKEKITELHTADGVVACPACKKKHKVVLKTRKDAPATRTEVVYVNEKGEEVAFVAKPSAK